MELSDAAAKSLSKFKGESLDLSGLTSLSDAAVKSFSDHGTGDYNKKSKNVYLAFSLEVKVNAYQSE